MNQIALALIFYDEKHGSLPEATTFDQNGNPLHSWRTAILPYLEQRRLYDLLNLNEPWDSPANKPLTISEMEVFGGWFHPMRSYLADTAYYVVTGPGTLWPAEGPHSLRDIPDGAANTIMVIESAKRAPWAKPDDLTADAALNLLTSAIEPEENGGHYMPSGLFYNSGYGRNVVMADGSGYRLRGPLPEKLAHAILTADGGEEVNVAELEAWSGPELDRAKVACFSLFWFVAILPVVRLAKRTRSGSGNEHAGRADC